MCVSQEQGIVSQFFIWPVEENEVLCRANHHYHKDCSREPSGYYFPWYKYISKFLIKELEKRCHAYSFRWSRRILNNKTSTLCSKRSRQWRNINRKISIITDFGAYKVKYRRELPKYFKDCFTQKILKPNALIGSTIGTRLS